MASSSKLCNALTLISSSRPRIINLPPSAVPPGPGAASLNQARRASVALIIRLRPTTPLPPPAVNVHVSQGSGSGTPPSSSGTPPQIASGETESVAVQLNNFFSQGWVKDPTTVAEVLFIKRVTRKGDRWSGDVALPGGKSEPEDSNGKYTAMRETFEEVGIDLAEKDWICVGSLDDREITTSLGKRLLMILSPYVFLYAPPATSDAGLQDPALAEAPLAAYTEPRLELQTSEIASAHWIPLEMLMQPNARVGSLGIDISSRLAPRSPLAQIALRLLIGSMFFRCILLPNNPVVTLSQSEDDGVPVLSKEREELRLWGLTLGMTLDLLSKLSLAPDSPDPLNPPNLSTYPHATLDLPPLTLSSSLTTYFSLLTSTASATASIFPRFSYPDINLLIYLFGWRYRRLLVPVGGNKNNRGASAGGIDDRSGDQRVNYAGVALGSYYESVRKALVVAVLLRGVLLGSVLGAGGWWSWKKLVEKRKLK